MIRYERSQNQSKITKSIRVTDCPMRVVIEPWREDCRLIRSETLPVKSDQPVASAYPNYSRYSFDAGQAIAEVKLHLQSTDNTDKQ